MQEYLRDQKNNPKSYNLVLTMAEYVPEFLCYLHFPVAFDTMMRTLEAMLEVIQGPNVANQDIFIQRNIVELAKKILEIEYNDRDSLGNNSAEGFERILTNKLTYGPSVHSIRSNKLSRTAKNSGKGKFDMSSEEVTPPSNNFMISLAKYNVLQVLLMVIEGRRYTSYVYYALRRVLNPEIFRMNFAYQHHFLRRYHKNEYAMNLFFRYDKDLNVSTKSPMIIETGFLMYFLLMKMKENLYIDMDEKYYNRLISLLSVKERAASSAVRENFLLSLLNFFYDVFVLIIVCCRRRNRGVSKDRVKGMQENDAFMRQILKFYCEHVSQIEIVKDGKSYYQYFPLLPYCKFSSEEPKEKFKELANRTNAKTKCESLMKESKYLIIDLRVNYWLRKGLTRFVGLLQKYLDLMKTGISYTSAAVNAIVLFSFSTEVTGRMQDPALDGENARPTEIVLIVLGVICLLFTLVVAINVVVNRIPIKIQRYDMKDKERVKRERETGRLVVLRGASTLFTNLRYLLGITWSIVTDLEIIFLFSMLFCTLCGIFWHPFFYTFLLTYLIYRSPALMDVLQAIWYPRETLVLTIAMMFMVIYAFTVVSYWSYSDYYTDTDCYSLLTCFIVSFDNTFKNDGGLGGYLGSAYTHTEDKVTVDTDRVIYDNLAFLIVGILLIEIVSGIIIDTFAELRQKRDEIKVDAKSNCFI